MPTIEEPTQFDLAGQPATSPPASTLPPDPESAPKAVQLGLDVDVPVAIRLPHGLGVAHQDTLLGGS